MPRREKVKNSVKEFTGQVKAFFKRPGDDSDVPTTTSNTPPSTPPHTSVPVQPGPAENPSRSELGASSPARVPTSPPVVQFDNPSPSEDRSELTLNPTLNVHEVSPWEVTVNRVVSTEQMTSPSQTLELTGERMANTRTDSNTPRFGEKPGSDNAPHKPSQEARAKKSVGLFATGLVESAAGALKIGPLQGIADMLQGFADMYQLEGTVKKEYEELRQRLQTLLIVIQNHCDEDMSPEMESKINEIRDVIEGELSSVSKDPSGKRQGRLRMVKSGEDRFISSCHRIQEYIEQLSLGTTLLVWKMEEQQSKDKITSLIRQLPSSSSAWYDSGSGVELKRRACTSGTRLKILAELLDWANTSVTGVYWLNGMAGTGKTTIAYSVCQELDAKRSLAASFFCSRQLRECRDVKTIIPSIAYQLARFSPPFRSALSIVLEKEPEIHARPLPTQFKMLLQEPLLAAQPLPTRGLVVVIDALDECENKDSTRDILELLSSKAADLPMRFIVSSRPEPQIRDELTDDRAKSRLVLHELDKGEVKGDVEKYLREGLAPMNPSDEHIKALVEKAGILFIYAATVVRYIGYDNFRSDPKGRLADILEGPQSPEDGVNDDEIDQLYMTILEAALGNRTLRKAQRDDMRRVLYTVVCARQPLTTRGLSELLGINDVERVRAALRPLWSVLHVVGANELVTTLHASFPDFMFDPTRSGSHYCDSDTHHHKLAEHCFNYIARTQPQFNICGLESSYVSDEKVPNIKTRVAESISSELLYACRYWAEHAKTANCALGMVEQMRDFLSTRLLLWMEVLNLTNNIKAGMECMKLVAEWCKEMELAELVHDAKRFVDAFASNPVSQSTPHIYVSMLAFWPKSAPITKHYAKYTRGPVKAEGTALDRRQLAHLSTWAFGKAIYSMAVSPDGQHIALSVRSDMLVVDSSSGKVVLGPLQDHPNEVREVAFTPDGSRILARLSDGRYNIATILGWDTRTGDAVLGPPQLHGHTYFINSLSFSSDCSRIATGSDDKTVCLWDAETGQMLHRFEAQDTVGVAVFSPDGTQVAAGAGETLHRWASRTGESTHIPLTPPSIRIIAYSPDQSCLISGTLISYLIYVWDALSGEMIRSLEGHTDAIRCIGYSPDGRYIASGSRDQTVRVWDAQSGDMVLGPLEGHTDWINSIAFSPDGAHIISACESGRVCTWDARQRNLTHSSTGAPSDPITCAKFSSDGTRFVTGSTKGTIHIWDAHTGEVALGPIQAHSGPVRAVGFKDGQVVSGSKDGKICVCDARSGEIVLGPLEVGSKVICAIAYSPDGELIATGSSDGVYVWSAQHGGQILDPLTNVVSYVTSLQFSPDGTRIIVGSGNYSSNVVVWDISDEGNEFGTLDGHQRSVYSVSYSPNGALIASGSSDCTIIIWDAYTGKKKLGPLTAHSWSVHSVSFSPDSTRLVSGSFDRKIRIWDVQTGEMLFELSHGHENSITSVEYSPDGTRIMSLSDDLSVRIHDARSPEERAQSRPESEVGDWTIDEDGWVVDDQSRLLVWVPGDLRKALMPTATRVMISPQGYVGLTFDKSSMGESWAQSFASRK